MKIYLNKWKVCYLFSLKDESTLMKTGKASEEHEEIHMDSDGTDSLWSSQTTSDQEHVSAPVNYFTWKCECECYSFRWEVEMN